MKPKVLEVSWGKILNLPYQKLEKSITYSSVKCIHQSAFLWKIQSHQERER